MKRQIGGRTEKEFKVTYDTTTRRPTPKTGTLTLYGDFGEKYIGEFSGHHKYYVSDIQFMEAPKAHIYLKRKGVVPKKRLEQSLVNVQSDFDKGYTITFKESKKESKKTKHYDEAAEMLQEELQFERHKWGVDPKKVQYIKDHLTDLGNLFVYGTPLTPPKLESELGVYKELANCEQLDRIRYAHISDESSSTTGHLTYNQRRQLNENRQSQFKEYGISKPPSLY